MQKLSLLLLSLIVLFFGCQKDFDDDKPSTKEDLQPDSISIDSVHTIPSKILGEDRQIIVSLPEGYAETDANYPVLYLTDGFQNIEHVRGAVELLTRTGHIPPIIIVGMKSVNRVRDFTFTNSENEPQSGGGDKFLAFIESELMPYINTNYRTNDFKVLEGHSLGGLFTATTLMENPDLFQGFIVMSPAFWWNGEELTAKAKTFFSTKPDLGKTLFFGIGKDESSEELGMRKELSNFIEALKANGIDYAHKEFEGEGHMSSALLSNYYGLKHTFADLKYSDEFIANYTDEAFLKKETAIASKYGQSAKRTGETYYNLGAAIYQDNLPGAITVFKRGVEVYPNDMNLIATLALLYKGNGETAKAIETYRYAIKISKENNYGKEESYQTEIDKLKGN